MNKKWILVIVLLIAWIVGRYMYKKPSAINGAKAADFTAFSAKGDSISLSDVLKKGHRYILLDFWGSWCGPCRVEAPELVAFYDEYKAKQLEIIGIAIENNQHKWLQAIEQWNLHWTYHVSDLKHFDSPLAKQFGVRVIPTKILLNHEGTIIAVNPTFEELRKIVN
jgi:thiol-disulfide isomerase/thioredoxin